MLENFQSLFHESENLAELLSQVATFKALLTMVVSALGTLTPASQRSAKRSELEVKFPKNKALLPSLFSQKEPISSPFYLTSTESFTFQAASPCYIFSVLAIIHNVPTVIFICFL